MYNDTITQFPIGYAEIESASQAMGFSMPSDLQTGALLKTLAGSKPSSTVLEIGTGTGFATAWLLAGMDAHSTLMSIDNEPMYQTIAQQFLGHDSRLTLICIDAGQWLEEQQANTIDLIFADAWPGKYANLDAALNLLKAGGLYVIDDMMSQPNWPAGHIENVVKLVVELEQRTDINIVKLAWSTGILIATKR